MTEHDAHIKERLLFVCPPNSRREKVIMQIARGFIARIRAALETEETDGNELVATIEAAHEAEQKLSSFIQKFKQYLKDVPETDRNVQNMWDCGWNAAMRSIKEDLGL